MNDKEKLDMYNRIVSNSSNSKEQMYNRIVANYEDNKSNKVNSFNSNRSKLKFNNIWENNKEKIKNAMASNHDSIKKKRYENAGAFTKLQSKALAKLENKSEVDVADSILRNRNNNTSQNDNKDLFSKVGKFATSAATVPLMFTPLGSKVSTPVLTNQLSKNNDSLNYIGKRAGAGVLGGLNGILKAGTTEMQNNMQKGQKENKNILENIGDVATSTVDLVSGNGLKGMATKAFAEGIKTLADKNSTPIQKLANMTNNASSGALEMIPGKRLFDNTFKLIGNNTPEGSDKVIGNVSDTISKPYDNLKTKLNEEGKKYNNATQTAGNVAEVVGNMVPSVGASIVAGPEAGLLTTGISAKGTATEEALAKGAQLDQAVKIGDTKGMVEAGTELLAGGINFFGKGALDDIVEKGLIDKVSNKVGKFLIRQGYDFAGEVGEEIISDVIGTLIDKGTVDPNAKYSIEELGETTATTILSTAVLKALGVPVNNISDVIMNNKQKNIQTEENNTSQSIETQKENEINISNRFENKNSQNAISEQIRKNTQNSELSYENIANNNKNMYNNSESEGGNNEQVQLGRMLEGNTGLSGVHEENMQQDRKYTREEYNEWERKIKPLERGQLDEQKLKLIDDIKRQYDKDIVFFDGSNSSEYFAGASYNNKNRINIDAEQVKSFGLKKVIYHEVAESDILHNKELSADVIQPAIQMIIEDPNFEKQKLEFWNNQEGQMPSDYLIAKDILCDRFSELKTGENIDYKNVLSQETNMTIDFSLNNFHQNLYNNEIQKEKPKIDFTRKINKETAIDKYNTYKQNILKGRAEEVNTLIKNKNETINSLKQKIAEKQKLLEQKANKDTVEANRIKMYIGTLQQRINRIENEYNSRIDRKNEKITKDNIKLQLKKETKTTRKDIQEGLLEKTGLKNENFDDAKNITMLNLNRTSPERVNEKVFGHELGTKVNDAIISPTKHNEAEKTRFKNKEREDIKSWGIKDHSKESAVLQKYAEKSYVNENDELVPYTENDLKKDIKDESIRIKIRNAAKELRAKYDMYIDKANEILVKLGYDPIPKREDYVRHFNELNDIFTRFGIPGKIQNENALPTDINGITDTFMPGKSYFANTQKRQGIKTTYDAITGIDGYIEGISNLIYHTEDIQRLRAFEKYIRETYGETGWDKMEGLTEEQKVKRMQNIESNHLSNYAAWLTEYTNNLAGKKSGIDRSVEKLLGRNIYSTLNTIKKQVGSNMTGFNISSALSNFVSVIQGGSKTKKTSMIKGSISTFKNIFAKDDFINKSDFLTNRFGSDRIHKTPWEKMSNAGQVFMNATDYFTANLIVRSKYYENLSKGMSESEAIKKADDFGARIMGDRSLGSTPVLFNSKTLGVVTQFQFEVFNQYDSMIHDTIQDYKVTKDNKGALRASMGAVWSLGQLMAFSYFFNNAYEAVLGTRPAFDVIDIIKTAFGLDDDDDSEDTLQDNLHQASKKLIEALPVINLFSENARIPTASGIPNPIKLATGESTLKDEAKKLIYLVPPTGGNQAKKTIQGAEAVINGGSYTTSKNGEKKLQFKVDNKDPKEVLKALMFGKRSTSDAKLYDSKPLTEKEQREMEDLDISFKDYKQYKSDLAKINEIQSDKDKNGKAISGSASGKKAYSIMNNKDYSTKEKEFLISKLNSEDSKKQVTVSDLKKLDNSEETYKYYYGLTAEKQKQFISDLKEYNFNSNNLVKYYKNIDKINDKYSEETKAIKEQKLDSDDEKNRIAEINSRKKNEIAENLLNSNYDNKQKLYLYSKSYSTNDVEMAQKLDINADAFIKVDSQGFKSDKYINGKTVRNSKLNKVYRYVESLPKLSVSEKAILIKSQVSSFDKYNNQIIQYVDKQDLTIKDKEEILKNMGFKIKNGRVYD